MKGRHSSSLEPQRKEFILTQIKGLNEEMDIVKVCNAAYIGISAYNISFTLKHSSQQCWLGMPVYIINHETQSQNCFTEFLYVIFIVQNYCNYWLTDRLYIHQPSITAQQGMVNITGLILSLLDNTVQQYAQCIVLVEVYTSMQKILIYILLCNCIEVTDQLPNY